MNPDATTLPVAPPAPALEPVAPVQALNRPDDPFYEELTRTNNELANLQREMARKNAELTVAQRKLQASEQRYRSLSACSPIGILEMAVTGRCLYTNPHWQAITGLTANESLGDGWQRVLDSRDAAAFLEEWNLALRAGVRFSREFRFETRGDPRWAQIRSQSIHAEHGEVVGHVSTVEDITERKQAETALAEAHRALVDVSRRAGMAEIATNVLHNVGNVLNSVNISTGLIVESVKKSRVSNLARVVVLLQEHAPDLGEFITHDAKGRQLPVYLAQLSEQLLADQAAMVGELDSLQRNVEHIKEIVAAQQSYAMVAGVKERVDVVQLVEDSLRVSENAAIGDRVEIIREFETVPPMNIEKHKVLQILVNLVRNAHQACHESDRADRRVTLRVAGGDGRVRISVTDNGVGISPENLTRIFSHGFTNREGGHGLGLHSGALAAKELGGSLSAQSAGPGQGAVFTLELPGPTPEQADGHPGARRDIHPGAVLGNARLETSR